MHAFWELSSCRQFGYSMGPIPWNAIMDYAERKGLDMGMISVFEVVVRTLDEAYLSDLRDERRKRDEQSRREQRSKARAKQRG